MNLFMIFIKIIVFASKVFFFRRDLAGLIKFTHFNFYFNDKQNYLRIFTSTKNK